MDSRYSPAFRFRIWCRRWFFFPFTGPRALYRDLKDNYSPLEPERFIYSKDGQEPWEEASQRRVKDLKLVRSSLRSDNPDSHQG